MSLFVRYSPIILGGGGGGGGVSSIGPFGSTPNAAGGDITGSILTLEPADATHPGGISLSAQSMGAGNKTFAANIFSNNSIEGITNIASAAGVTTLTATSTKTQRITGVTTQAFNLPDATTLQNGHTFEFSSLSTVGVVSVYKSDGTTLLVAIPAGGDTRLILADNSTALGNWNIRSLLPSNASYGSAGAIVFPAGATLPALRGTLTVGQLSSSSVFSMVGGSSATFPFWDFTITNDGNSLLQLDNPHTSTIAQTWHASGTVGFGIAAGSSDADHPKVYITGQVGSSPLFLKNNATSPGNQVTGFASDGSTVLWSVDNAGLGLFTGANMTSHKIINVTDPTSAQDAATKAYVDSAAGATQAPQLTNVGISTSVSSGTLTVALKQANGSSDPAAGTGTVSIGMRGTTAATGSYNVRTVTAALSQTIQAGTQLSTQNFATAQYLWIYAIDSDGAGTMKLGVSSARYDDGTIVSTVADYPTVTISNASPGVVTLTAHGYNNGDQVSFKSAGGTLPTGITQDNVYFVVNKAANTFQISNSYAGGAITTSSAGSGTFHVLCADNRIISAGAYASVSSRLIGRILGVLPSVSTGWASGFTEATVATPAVAASISPTGGFFAIPGRNQGSMVQNTAVPSATVRYPLTMVSNSDGTFNDAGTSAFQALNISTAAVTGTLPLTRGGTGQTSKAAAFDGLSPMTSGGDLIYGGSSGTGTRLPNGSAGQFVKSAGTTLAPLWATLATTDMPLSAATSTGGGTITNTSDYVICNPSAATPITITLPAANTVKKLLFLSKKDSDTASPVTISRAGSDTINYPGVGTVTSIQLNSQNDSVTLLSDESSVYTVLYSNVFRFLSSAPGAYSFSSLGATGGRFGTAACKVTLTPGMWRITGYFVINIGTGTGQQVLSASGFFGADGGNSASTPTAFSGTVSGDVSFASEEATFMFANVTTTANARIPCGVNTIVATVSASTDIYLVPKLDYTVAGTSTITPYMTAERIR